MSTSPDNLSTTDRVLGGVSQLALLAGAWFAYRVVRMVGADRQADAFANARQVVDFQEMGGIAIERSLQAFVLGNDILVTVANWYYLAHFPVTIAVLLIAWKTSRFGAYVFLRNSLVGVTSVALVAHAVFPLAPPRMLPGYVDTGKVLGPSPYDIPGSGAANQFAAMPSMHVAWALIVALTVFALTSRRWIRAVAVFHAVATTLVVVLTGNHFVIDALIAFALVALVACLLVIGTELRDRRRARLAHTATA